MSTLWCRYWKLPKEEHCNSCTYDENVGICSKTNYRHIILIVRFIILIWLITLKGFHSIIIRKPTIFLTLSIAAALLFSLCLKHLVLGPVSLRPPPPDRAQSALIGKQAHSVEIGQPLPSREEKHQPLGAWGAARLNTGGTYLQDELLEEEKHERPQRSNFFLGRPWTICSWRGRVREAIQMRKKIRGTNKIAPCFHVVRFPVSILSSCRHISPWRRVFPSFERAGKKQGVLQSHLLFSVLSQRYWIHLECVQQRFHQVLPTTSTESGSQAQSPTWETKTNFNYINNWQNVVCSGGGGSVQDGNLIYHLHPESVLISASLGQNIVPRQPAQGQHGPTCPSHCPTSH